MRLRSCIIKSVFHKSLKLSISAINKRSSGQITNLMSLDSTRLQELTPYLHAVWYSLFQIGVAISFLWQLVGPSCLGGVLIIICCIPIIGQISIILKGIQNDLSAVRDERVKMTSEVLTGIRVIKLQAWESEFQKRMTEIRNKELRLYRKYAFIQSLSGTFSSAVPLLVAIATFTVFIWTGGVIDVATALTALALFDILRFPLFMLPTVMNNLVEAKVAMDRIKSFMLESEKECISNLNLKDTGVIILKGTMVWESIPQVKNPMVSKHAFSYLLSFFNYFLIYMAAITEI
jgi:ABC-type bacteriocin/lantibiotic exporter with double-glycine peptidase domain